MNYAWVAYEKGLHHLLQHFPQNHPEYANVCILQKRLYANITRAKSQGDTEVLRVERKRIIAYLENATKLVMEDGFMALSRAHCVLFHYIAIVYETTSYVNNVFGGDRVWPEQCQYIVEDFRKKPAVAEAAKGLVESTRVALYHIDTRVAELIRLVEEYERISRLPNRRLGNRHDEVIRQAGLLIEEIQTIDTKSFQELIEWRSETILSANLTEASNSTDAQALTPAEPEQPLQEPDQQPALQDEEEFPQQRTQRRGGEASFSEEEIDQAALRDAIARRFGIEDLRILCFSLNEALRRDNIEIDAPVNLDELEGSSVRGKAQSLVEFFDKRQILPYLVVEMCKARPRLKLCKDLGLSGKKGI